MPRSCDLLKATEGRVEGERVSGFVGTAAVPVCALLLESFVGWRGAFIGSAAIGLFAAAPLHVCSPRIPR